MLGLTPNNHEKFFFLLNEAIVKNTVRPRPNEEEKMTVSRVIRCSPEIEGDSQLGILLFCGMASVIYNIPGNAIIDHTGIEQNEFAYKVKKFKTNLSKASKLPKLKNKLTFEVISNQELDLRKLHNKVRLINNYIMLYGSKYNILFTKIRNV